MRRFLLFTAMMALAGCISMPPDAITVRQNARRDLDRHPEKAGLLVFSPDPEIRRYSLYLLAKQKGADAKLTYKAFLLDGDEQVRLTALAAIIHYCGRESDVMELMAEVASKDSSPNVTKLASSAAWPFHRDVLLIRNDPSWDHEVEVVKKFQIPDDKWKFKLDPRGVGHMAQNKWYEEKANDSDWAPIKLGEWEKQGYDYDGIAWYRIRFDMPEKVDCNAVELAFEGVDECAWVWLNGVYLGCHDLGVSGWNIPFALDCRKEIRWGQENTLVVRIFDSAMDGGIYRPVHVEILK